MCGRRFSRGSSGRHSLLALLLVFALFAAAVLPAMPEEPPPEPTVTIPQSEYHEILQAIEQSETALKRLLASSEIREIELEEIRRLLATLLPLYSERETFWTNTVQARDNRIMRLEAELERTERRVEAERRWSLVREILAGTLGGLGGYGIGRARLP
jgi:predicted RNase H-like nuclease (RuvC/YqgF family)